MKRDAKTSDDYAAAAKTAVLTAARRGRDFVRAAVIAGQVLNEWAAVIKHGDFEEMRRQLLPQFDGRTLQRWQRCATFVLYYVAPDAPKWNIPISKILQTDAGLSQEFLEFRVKWDAFIADKTLTDILANNEAATIRALHGKFRGGTNQYDNRKDFTLFIANKASQLAEHFSHFPVFTEDQKFEVEKIFEAMCLGKDLQLDREVSRSFNFSGRSVGFRTNRSRMLPIEVVDILLRVLKKRKRIDESSKAEGPTEG